MKFLVIVLLGIKLYSLTIPPLSRHDFSHCISTPDPSSCLILGRIDFHPLVHRFHVIP